MQDGNTDPPGGDRIAFQLGEGKKKVPPSQKKYMYKDLQIIMHSCETVQNPFRIRAFPGLRSETWGTQILELVG